MNIPSGVLPNARAVDKYLRFLACPCCRDEVFQRATDTLVCRGCARRYRVLENIPILLPPFLLCGNGWQRWENLEDGYVRFYAKWSKESHLAVRAAYRSFYDWCDMRDSQNVSVLDVGGANGIHRVIEWNYPEKINYFNLDPRIHFLHPYHVELYPREKEIDFPYVLGVGEYLPFRSNVFDVCVSTAAVDHFMSPADVFHEIFRCLKVGGKLFLMATKEGASPATKRQKSLLPRIADFCRGHGFAATVKNLSRRMPLLPSLVKPRKSDPHAHHFRSIGELTDLLSMFNVTRSTGAEVGQHSRFYIECEKR